MNTATQPHDDRSQVLALLDTWVKGFLAKDVASVVSTYAEDIVAFDAIQQLQFKGRAAYQAHWEMCMAMCPGAPSYEVREQRIDIGGDLAIVHYLGYCGGTDAKGNPQGCWSRVTQGFRKTNGRWAIVHEHFSFPVDIESGKAIFDAQP
ncbi:SnoaL-like domain protein [compost metagenome]